jgi:hypothetical protein
VRNRPEYVRVRDPCARPIRSTWTGAVQMWLGAAESSESAAINQQDQTGQVGAGCSRLAHGTCPPQQEQPGTVTSGEQANIHLSRRSYQGETWILDSPDGV